MKSGGGRREWKNGDMEFGDMRDGDLQLTFRRQPTGQCQLLYFDYLSFSNSHS